MPPENRRDESTTARRSLLQAIGHAHQACDHLQMAVDGDNSGLDIAEGMLLSALDHLALYRAVVTSG